MTYFNAIRKKKHVFFDIEQLNTSVKSAAYRVPEDAEFGLLLLYSEDASTVTIKTADSVFGGKDQKIECEPGCVGVFLELNNCIQTSGEHKGCVLIESTENTFDSELIICTK